MISVSLLGTKDNQSSSSLLELDMGSDSQLHESFSQSSSMDLLEDDVLVSMLVQLENGMFQKRQQEMAAASANKQAATVAPSPPSATHTQRTPEAAARKFLYQMGESLSSECMFTAADLLGMSDD